MFTTLKALAAAAVIALPLATAHAGEAKKDIVDTAVEAGNFTTLVKALKATGLDATLKQDGPFTVFAPSDAAFGKLPSETLAGLLKPEGKEQLTKILSYHVVAGKKIMAGDIAGKSTDVATVEGATLKADATGEMVKINEAVVKTADIKTSNGVIHVINQVLMPPMGEKKSDGQS